ncbi:unnamed protein product [Larinioides sclopetarius]|uniref:Gem-associated protein 5 n=1 Tax=Larinioides sclopetarius TaxID=280406 RepID=A0AAV2AGI4_9ARAC
MSSEVLVLPSFNRHFPQAFSQSPSGIIAYGCRNIIYFIDARCYPPVILDSKCIHRAYKEKVAALSFCKCENTELIASISDCGEVKIWDINTGTCVNNFIGKEGICNIEWIHGSPNTVVFPQDSKVLLKWNFSTGYVTKIKFGTELKTCFITSNEKCPHLLAVAHNNGTITVLDIVQEKILHKLKDHCRDINNLAWSPVLPDTLLSVGSDFSVRSWKMGEEKSTKSFWIGRIKPDDRRRIRVMGICHPKEADVMICSNCYGEIGEVALSEEKPRFKPYSKMGGEVICKILFALFSGTLKTEQGTVDILYCFDIYIFSIWNITEKNLISFLPLFMGFVYDLSFSPVNPIYLCISNGDGILRVWNAQADSQTSRIVSVFVQAKTKIMTAAWHPAWENVIAFGTDDGKIGIIDSIKKRALYPFETFHKGRVYCVCWGPCKASSIEDAGSDEYFIYSCGGGEIFMNRYKKLNEPALNFHEIATRPTDIETIENTCSEIIWKSDYSCVCIGTYKGFIDVYNDKLVFQIRCNLEMKSIECLRWHPESTYMSPTGSPLKSWLACSGNDLNIYIVDTSKIFEKSENSADWIVKKLTGHKKQISATSWSPHMDGYLVSASKDGSALVWHACTGNIIASYLDHSDIVNTVQWSVFDEDVIYSGGQDNCVRVWRISQQKSVAPADKAPLRKKLRRPKLSARGADKLQDSGDETVPENGDAILENGSTFVENSETYVDRDKPAEIVETETIDEGVPVACSKIKYSDRVDRLNLEGNHDQALWLNHVNKKTVSLFGSSFKSTVKEEDLKDFMKLADILCKRTEENDECFDPLQPSEGTLSDDDVMKFGLYTDQVTALRMADIQADNYKSNMDKIRFCQLSVMTNKMETLIKEAAENGTLSNYLVSLAPSVSYSFWLEICEKYALQLLQAQQPYVACTYFLMCNKVYEAIDVLKEKGKLIDALALARLRLPDSDPVIHCLLLLIRKRYRDLCNSVGEAKCYLSLNETLLAVKTLGSVPDASHAKVAAYICKKYNMNDEAEKYIFIFLQRCLMQCDWESFREFANEESSVQVYSILFAVHEVFYLHLQKAKKQSGIFVKEIFSLPNSEELVKFWNGTTCMDSDKSFMEYICDVLESRNLLPMAESSLKTIIQSLDFFLAKWSAMDSSSDAHVVIAVYIAKFILFTLMGDFATATANFLKIFESSCNIAILPKIIFVLFFPMKLLWSQKMKFITCQSRTDSYKSSTNMVVTQYQQIVQCVSEKIMTKSIPFDLTIVSKDDLQNNLHAVTEKIVTALSLKGIDEFILAYFASYIVHDLSRLMDKKVFKLECCPENVDSNLENKFDEKLLPSKIVEEVPPENNLIVVSSENDESEIQKEESPELEDLIDAALKEADEKIRTLTNSEESTVSKDASNIQIKDMPDLCSNGKQICEREENLNIGNEECQTVSNEEYFVEICSPETVSNLGNCIDQVSSSDASSHAECIASMDLFYHLILFIMSNICKEEFTLLHYLKERLKFLHLIRASHELSKFSKENKSKLIPKTYVAAASKKVKEVKNKNKDKSDKPVVEAPSTAVKTNQIEAFKDDDKCEHSNSPVESVNDDSNIDKNDKDGQSEPSDSAVESVNDVPNIDKNNVDGQSELSNSASETVDRDPNSDHINDDKGEPSTSALESVKDVPSADKNEDHRQNELSNSVIESFNYAPSADQNDGDKRKFSNSATEATDELHSDDNEVRTIISNDHNYSSPLQDFDPSQDTLKSAVKVDVDSNHISQDSDKNVKELSELIQLLESEAKGFSYPSPLDIVPKVLQILYDVRQNSTCCFIQEKLHTLIDEIVHWAETFQVPNNNFVCEICH